MDRIEWSTLRSRSTWLRALVVAFCAGLLADAVSKGTGATVFFIILVGGPLLVAVRSDPRLSSRAKSEGGGRSEYAVALEAGWHKGVMPPLDVVVGESHYQEALEVLAGPPRPTGWVVPVGFVLEREPTNKFDDNAIKVSVWGSGQPALRVGYLRAELAELLAPQMGQSAEEMIRLIGIVRGGWTAAPSFGVFLWFENEGSAALESLAGADLGEFELDDSWSRPLDEEQSGEGIPSLEISITSTYEGAQPATSRERKAYEAELAELRAATKARSTLFESRVDLMVGTDPTEIASARGISVCPGCGAVMESEVKSSRKCPECKQKILVRSKGGSKFLLTESESNVVGARKRALAALRKAHGRVEYFGVTAEQFLVTLEELGSGYSPRDASWKILNEQIADAMNDGRYSDMSFIYSTMARQLSDEGKDFSESLTKSAECEAKAEWLQANELGIEDYEGLRIAACSCSACAADDGRLIRWDELESTPSGFSGPLPHLDCENGVCHCTYQIDSSTSGEGFIA